MKAADVERRRGIGFEIIALHDVVRLGAPTRVLRRLANLASLVEDRPAPRYPAQADALAAAEGPRGADEGGLPARS